MDARRQEAGLSLPLRIRRVYYVLTYMLCYVMYTLISFSTFSHKIQHNNLTGMDN